MSSKDMGIIMYRSEDGTTKIDVRMEEETVWLSQGQMVELFQSSKANISEHIKKIFAESFFYFFFYTLLRKIHHKYPVDRINVRMYN